MINFIKIAYILPRTADIFLNIKFQFLVFEAIDLNSFLEIIYSSTFTQLEKEMATHSSTLAWKIPWTEKPGRLQSMGLQRVGHD